MRRLDNRSTFYARAVLVMCLFAISCMLFCACGIPGSAAGGEDETVVAEDVECEIGVTERAGGELYIATIQFADNSWDRLSEAQKNNVVDQCLATIDLAEETGGMFELEGVDKDSGMKLFIYSSDTQETVFDY